MQSPGTSHRRPWLLLVITAVAVGATAHQQPASTDARTPAILPLRAAFARLQRGSKSDLFAVGFVDLITLRGGGDNSPKEEAPPTTSADVEAPVEVDDTSTSIDIEEADDKTEDDPTDAAQPGDVSKGEKLEKVAYSLSGITRKVNDEDNDEDNEARSSAVSDGIAESAGDSEMPSVDDDGIVAESMGEEQLYNSLDVSPDEPGDDATIADGLDDSTNKPSSPLADLSNQLHEILLRHRIHSYEERKEVAKLRDLILERCEEYMDDIRLHATGETKKKPRHPRKLLHFLAPKIPAIKQSPDITLRIKSAKADLDGSVAAYAIGSIACMTELFDQHTSTLESRDSEGESKDDNDEDEEDAEKSESLASGDIVSDRRLEQLTECVLSSVDAKGIIQKIDKKDDTEKHLEEISTSLDPTDSLSVQDTAYTAFGLALLGARDLGKLGGYKPSEVFSILSLHCRDVLLAKEKQMKSKDFEAVQDVVHDVSTALWAFSCVKSICGYRSDDLFDTCCSILLLQESDLKQFVAEADELEDKEAESGDSALGNSTIESETTANVTDVKSTEHILPITIESAIMNCLGHRELINSLWALAIHGSSDNKALHWTEDTSSSSQTASETPEVLADLLLERIGCLLGDEIGRLSEEGGEEGQGNAFSSSNSFDNQNSDAESRDSFNDNQGNSTSINGVQEMLCDDKEAGDGTQEDGEVIQVISAAAILEEEARQRQDDSKSAKQKRKSAQKSDDNNEDETAPEATKEEEEEEMMEPQNDTNESNDGAQKEEHAILAERTHGDTASLPQSQLSFNDMCSIAWAATELGREASVDIVWRITILFCYSREDVTAVGGTALSNLAWAIAKNLEASNGSKLKPHIKTIVDWIAESSLEILSKQPRYLSKTATGKCFQPPELSRLLWSLSLIQSAETGVLSGGVITANRNPVLAALAAEAMRITSYDLPVFSVEDLARILWAFTELGDTSSEVDILSGSTVQSFGRIQETIEASLLRWESGQKNVTASQQHKEGGLFSRLPSTFFGRARSRRLSLLDLKISDDEDDDDDATSSKPTLKDLTVDPATLSKLCFGLAQVSRNHQQIIGSEQILRVASRLFSSKNGRLLSECSHKDIIRMCCACVDTMKLAGKELRGSDREFVLRQFPRRAVQLINTPLSDGRSYLDNLCPEDISAMLFALGELGVRASTSAESPETEHRRLRMVPPCPVLPEDMLDSLSLTSVANLVAGIIAIGDTSPKNEALAKAMASLQHRIDAVGPGETYLLCRLTAALSRLLRAPMPTSSTSSIEKKKKSSADSEIVNGSDESAVTTEEKVIENLSPAPPSSSADDNKNLNDGSNATAKRDQEEIRKEARLLLGLVLEQAAARISDMSGEQIRRILLHVALLPYQADEFIEAAETEVHKRLSALNADAETTGFGSLEELSQQTADAAIDVATSLSTSPPGEAGEGPFKFLKKGGKAKDLAAEANRAAASACEAAARLDRIHRGAHLKGEEILHQIEQGAAFELGRCLTLLERYHRIEFSEDSFSRRSRYDDERRKIIGKRVCSRLFF